MVSRQRSEINDDYSKATNAQNNRLQQQMNSGANEYCGGCVTTGKKEYQKYTYSQLEFEKMRCEQSAKHHTDSMLTGKYGTGIVQWRRSINRSHRRSNHDGHNIKIPVQDKN